MCSSSYQNMSDNSQEFLRFITKDNCEVEEAPQGLHHWMSKVGLTETELLTLVRVHMPPGKGHPFHRHPELEEIIYVISGRAEQWVEEKKQILSAGEMAHIPKDIIHGTYNPFDEPVVFLAILSPASHDGPFLIEEHEKEPWASLRTSD